ncbi:SsrA-binding protein [Mesomycoplasma conjunctivae]|uniref:SsrA-binding protein n=1 Tax=Mesomycoplasma conjunctivae (strain ATCC 25834 / NCTC 10147 / HRC/581) TaxID=572263 RepID=C5J706_MESCH|nr:SsrA-binding protein SmpB [Mesomycoplasma conjunctivae]CAT05269.1 SsrA-binding protein [Mesomycoplasma conjunctivae]VEU66499.1 SsrA-binding protein [Mesomycoplasma conjunctivae]
MKIISNNKIAKFDYQILDDYVAGISLLGWEVKSIRAGQVNLRNSFCYFKDNELFVTNMHVSEYMNVKGDPTRSRKLLLKRSQLNKLLKQKTQQKLTIIPLNIGWKNGKIKLTIALAKGKTKYDKRQSIKEKDEKRKIEKLWKNY